eukprot:jgi/Tetstr1/441636/TSEL_029862.t2
MSESFRPRPELKWGDGGGASAVGGGSACGVAAFRDVLPPELLRRLQHDVGKVLASNHVPVANPSSLTFGTYWWDAAASVAAPPRNAIEEAIAAMVHRVLPGVLDVAAMAGAEWWLQDTDSEDEPKEFHTDCDIQVQDDGSSLRRHPCVSSVFYLDAVGGGTLIAGQVKGVEGGLKPPLPRDLAVAFPHPNQLLLFRGNLLHAGSPLYLSQHPVVSCYRSSQFVLHPQEGFPTGVDRRTLLVNWWPTRPAGPADLPAAFCFPTGASSPRDTAGGALREPRAVEFRALQVDQPFAAHMAEWAKQRLPVEVRAWVGDGSDAGYPMPIFLRYTEDEAGAVAAWRGRDWTACEAVL